MKFNLYFTALSLFQSFQLILQAFYTLISNTRNTSSRFRGEFESSFQRKFNLNSAIAIPSNRSGIYALLSALDISHQDQVIVTGYTCAAVIEPILLLGATPVLVDVSRLDFTLRLDDLESKINTNTKAVIVQHSFGFSASLEEVFNILKDRGIYIIEDCALALGSRKTKFPLGSRGDAAIWSFELSKTISVGWGGMISIRSNKQLAKKIVELRDTFGNFSRISMARRLFQGGMSGIFFHPKMPHKLTKFIYGPFVKLKLFKASSDSIASNLSMPSDFQWKILNQQLDILSEINEHSRSLTNHYTNVLLDIGYPIFWSSAYDERIVLIRYPLLVQNPQRFVDYFSQINIEIGRWFSSPISGSEILTEFNYVRGTCPNSEWIGKHMVNLPLNPRINTITRDLISLRLKRYFDEYPEELEWIEKYFH